MAQRTGAERFLAPLRAASARVALALALAALLAVSGCGGDSEEETAGSGSSPTAAAEASPRAGGAQSAAAGEPAAGGGSSESQGSTEEGTGPGGKQGPAVAAPKGRRESAPTATERAEATVADMTLTAPAIPVPPIGETATLPAAHTCKGKDTWPALRWAGVPADTEELALYAMNIAPVQGKLFVDWAVAGLDPTLEGIDSGELPRGAIVGRNSFGRNGYSICPPEGREDYVFILFALPRPLGATRGFDPRELRQEILAVSGNAGILAVSAG